MFNLQDVDDFTPPDQIYTFDPRSTFNYDDKINIHLGLEILDLFCAYVIDIDNDLIPNAAVENLKTMFEMLDIRPYQNNDDLMARIEYIKQVLTARVSLSLTSKELINSYAVKNCDKELREIIETDIIPNLDNININNSTIEYINYSVYENLVEAYSMIYSPKFIKLLDKFRDGEFKNVTEFSNEFKTLVNSMNMSIQDSERYKLEGQEFDLSEKSMIQTVRKTLKALKAPSNTLRTGIQYLNRMLNGGFESGRSYLFAGLTGMGKSIILLSIANWMRKYNTLDKGKYKQLAVLFISQENSMNETIERLFNINVSGDNLKDLDIDQVILDMKKAGMIISDEDDQSINLIFKKYDDKEIGVSDIDHLIGDYDRQGIKIIAVVQDYIEKLKPKRKSAEVRFALGELSTELSELAKKRNIPVISAAQLNRMASSVVGNAIANNKKNTIKLLGKENISESWEMIKASDCFIIIQREIDDSSDVEKQYMGFKLEKYRGKPNEDRIFVFLHPFNETNGIQLIPDVDTKPLSRTRIEDFEPMKNTPITSESFDIISSDITNGSFIDIIDDDYKDSPDNYVDVIEKANEFATRQKLIRDKEIELRRMRKKELEKAKGIVVLHVDLDDNKGKKSDKKMILHTELNNKVIKNNKLIVHIDKIKI